MHGEASLKKSRLNSGNFPTDMHSQCKLSEENGMFLGEMHRHMSHEEEQKGLTSEGQRDLRKKS